MCISVFGPFSSPSNSLVILFILLDFPLCSCGCHIFSKSFGVFCIRLLLFFRVISTQNGRIFFRCFGMSCFICIVLPFVGISLIFLLLPVVSGLFPQVVLLFFLVLPFPFCSNISQRLFVLSF